MMNSHCQPASPAVPSIASSTDDSGAPITVDSGMATMNHAMMRVRYSDGNQVER